MHSSAHSQSASFVGLFHITYIHTYNVTYILCTHRNCTLSTLHICLSEREAATDSVSSSISSCCSSSISPKPNPNRTSFDLHQQTVPPPLAPAAAPTWIRRSFEQLHSVSVQNNYNNIGKNANPQHISQSTGNLASTSDYKRSSYGSNSNPTFGRNYTSSNTTSETNIAGAAAADKEQNEQQSETLHYTSESG